MVGLSPAPFGVDDREVDQFAGGLLGGEVSSGLDRLADLAVQRLDRVRGVDDSAHVGGESEKGITCSQVSRQVLPIIG